MTTKPDNSYVREGDGATMVEVKPGYFVNAAVLEKAKAAAKKEKKA